MAHDCPRTPYRSKDLLHYVGPFCSGVSRKLQRNRSYWLPSIMKHSHIALRFVPQTSFEAAAPMVVRPEPDVVTRIFMVARGLNNKEALHEIWESACLRASEPVEFWQAIVGISLERALDPTLFRVLEWGGMFVN